MPEALPEEEPSVLISAKALRILTSVTKHVEMWEINEEPADVANAIEDAESALERYPVIPYTPEGG